MFEDRRNDHQHGPEQGQASACPTPNSFQLPRVNMVATNGGAWCLPALHKDIAFELPTSSSHGEHRLMAEFGLQAHASAMPLPSGTFTTITETLRKQLQNYTSKHLSKLAPVKITLTLKVINDHRLAVVVGVQGGVEILRMRSLVESLNAAQDGLGWWVHQVASSAGKDGYPLNYTPRSIDSLREYTGPWGNTDEDFLDNIAAEGAESYASVEEAREELAGAFPSDLDKAVDGHTWMLARFDPKTKRRPKGPRLASTAVVKEFLKNHKQPAKLRAAVADFLALQVELDSTEQSSFKDALSSTDDRCAPFCDCQEERPTPIGSACIMVWHQHDVLCEIISEFEQREMECGLETLDQLILPLDMHNYNDPVDAYNVAIRFIKDLVTRHSAISKAFNHFERVT